MLRIRNRNDLFNIAEANPPTPAIGEALSSGKVELLGGFKPLYPSKRSGWIITVTSRRGTVWNVALTVNIQPIIYPRLRWINTWIVQRIPWEYWVGRINRDPTVYDGDHPIKYEERKQKARITNGL